MDEKKKVTEYIKTNNRENNDDRRYNKICGKL